MKRPESRLAAKAAALKAKKRHDQTLLKQRKWRAANPNYDREYYARNARQCKLDARERARRVRQATPAWLTVEERAVIRAIYCEAAQQGLHVDHIHPLRGKHICGLHVPANLQLLSNEENARKGRTFTPILVRNREKQSS